MIQLALRAVCDQCSWKGWMRVDAQAGVLTSDATGSNWRNGQNNIGYVGHDGVSRQDGLQMIVIPIMNGNIIECPHCHTMLNAPSDCGPDYEWGPCLFDPDADNLNLVIPEPPPLPAPEPAPARPAYFYDVWCPHCTHLDTLAVFAQNMGWYEAKCPKCSKAHQVVLNGAREKRMV